MGVFRENLFGAAKKDEEIEVLVAVINHVVGVVALAEIKRHRRACVNEHAVAVAAHEERNRLVHILVLHAHAIACVSDDLLAALVQARERFAAAENLFVVRQLKGRGDAAAQVAGAADERERNGDGVGVRVVDVLRARQQAACVVIELDVPGILDNHHAPVSARIGDLFVSLRHLP